MGQHRGNTESIDAPYQVHIDTKRSAVTAVAVAESFAVRTTNVVDMLSFLKRNSSRAQRDATD